jgi:hypothetical protein
VFPDTNVTIFGESQNKTGSCVKLFALCILILGPTRSNTTKIFIKSAIFCAAMQYGLSLATCRTNVLLLCSRIRIEGEVEQAECIRKMAPFRDIKSILSCSCSCSCSLASSKLSCCDRQAITLLHLFRLAVSTYRVCDSYRLNCFDVSNRVESRESPWLQNAVCLSLFPILPCRRHQKLHEASRRHSETLLYVT